MDPPTDQEVNAALSRLLARARAQWPDVRMVLFGSRARATHLLTSDADVLIVTAAFRGMRDDARCVAALEMWDGPVSLQPLCFTPEEYEERRQQISIVSVAAQEGRALS